MLARAAYSGPHAIGAGDVGAGVIAAAVFLAAGKSWGFYKFQALLAPARIWRRVAAASLLSSLAVVCLVFLLKSGADHSRGVMVLFAILALALAPISRFAFAEAARFALAADVVRGRRVVLIGEVGELERLAPTEMLNFGFEDVGRFALASGGAAQDAAQDVVNELAAQDQIAVAKAMEAARSEGASEFALILPWSRERAIAEIVAKLRASPLPVRLYPDHHTRDILLQKRESHFDPYFSVEIQREPLSRLERVLKRSFDVFASAAALIVLAPFLLAIALLIKLDSPGPALFLQTRRGFDNRPFKIWKFRTMTVCEDGPLVRQASRWDNRVTRIGRMLRRGSVDELPQLVNVLRGDMSIVGPRPHAVAHDEHYERKIGEYALRRHVKPGVTGAAQVVGLRGETRELSLMEARVQRDLWYINNWSLRLDIQIIARTFVALVTHEAY